MAKIQWLSSPNIGDQIQSPLGGAWIWDGCIWKHTCCVPTVCDYVSNGGINISFNLTEEGNPGGSSFRIYYWVQYSGLYNGQPSFESLLDTLQFTIQYNGSQWELSFFTFSLSHIFATSDSLYGPWIVQGSPGDQIPPVTIQTECGPYLPKCIEINDVVNSYTETKVWIPLRWILPEIGTMWIYIPLSYSQSAIAGNDFIDGIIKITDTYSLEYNFNYISPEPEGFSINLGNGIGTGGDELPNGVYTYTQNGENITITISNDEDYSCIGSLT